MRIDPGFDAFLDELAALTPFAVRFRYPGPADPTTEQVLEALDVVEKFTQFVRGRLPPGVLGAEPPSSSQS